MTEVEQGGAIPVAGSEELRELLARIAVDAEAREREERRPFEAVDEVRRARLGALRVPVAEGGGGRSLRELFEVLISLAEADANVAHLLRGHFAFVESRLLSGDREASARWLPKVAAGAIFASAIGEVGPRGINGEAPQTMLLPEGEDYVLRGEKHYSTGCLFADLVSVRATMPGGEVVNAVVPADRDGVVLVDDWDGFGQRLTGSGTTRLEGVAVGAEEILALPGTGDGPRYLSSFLGLYLTTVIAGILRSVANDAGALVRGRTRNFDEAAGVAPADDPLLQERIGEIAGAAFAAEAMVVLAAEALDAAAVADPDDEDAPDRFHEAALRAAKAKLVVDELAIRAAGRLFDVGGASATSRSKNLDRHWRNIRTIASHRATVYKSRAVGNHLVNGIQLPHF